MAWTPLPTLHGGEETRGVYARMCARSNSCTSGTG